MSAGLASRGAAVLVGVIVGAVALGPTLLARCGPPREASGAGRWGRVVGLEVTTCDGARSFGSGVVDERGLVLTAAHVVADGRRIAVRDGRSTESNAVVIERDDAMDLAVLRVDGLRPGTAADAEDRVRAGASAEAVSFRGAHAHRQTIRIVRAVTIAWRGPGGAAADRPGFELTGRLLPGDSGGALVVDGAVVGLLWARSTTVRDRAYALRLPEARHGLSAEADDSRTPSPCGHV